MATRRALVIGGSLGGLLAANLLRHAGWDVTVFERNAEDLTGRGAGISTHPQLIDILHRVGIDFDESMGIRVDTVICLDKSGKTYLETKTARTMSSWGRLYRSLRDPLPAESYRLGMALRKIEQDAGSVTAVFADGSRVRGDLLVGADGVRSTVREQFLPDIEPNYAGYVAWRAMLDESDVPPDIRAEIFERYTFCLPDGELFLAYPVPGRNNETQAGRRAYNIVWYRPTDRETTLVDLCTDATGRRHGTAIPPPLIRPEITAAIKATARALVAPQVAEIFARTPQPFFQPIFDLESPQTVFGRVASPRRRWMRQVLRTRPRTTILSPACNAIRARNNRSAAAWLRWAVKKGPISALSSSRASSARQRSCTATSTMCCTRIIRAARTCAAFWSARVARRDLPPRATALV
jgi:2-polyprenyl-6-methoxyphenol hydroxylase-like FAD-dependent oxidoreductase